MDACAITHDELDLRVRFPDRGGASHIPTADLKRFGLALARRRSAGRRRLRRAYRPHSANLFRAQRGRRQRGAEEAMRVLTGDAPH